MAPHAATVARQVVAANAAATAHVVMPAKAGIHDLLCANEGKSWMPAFAGMTWGEAPPPALPCPALPPTDYGPRLPPDA